MTLSPGDPSPVGHADAAIKRGLTTRADLDLFDLNARIGMLGARRVELVRLGLLRGGRERAVKAVARPNAFPNMQRDLACVAWHWLGRSSKARAHAAAVEVTPLRATARRTPYGRFPFDRDGQTLFRRGARLVGLT